MRLSGILTVARLEFRLRIRAGRWRWLVAAWFLVLLGITALVRAAAGQQNIAGNEAALGAVMFGVVVLVVLALALLVAPALAAQSVNGDRERGTLATLQVTRLSAGEIAVGKLLASWGTALVFLAVTLPLALWCFVEGGLSVLRVAGVYLVTALLLGVVCAISLALSALLARSTTSGVLAYLAVFTLTVGTLIAWGLLTAATQQTVRASNQVCDNYVGGDEDTPPTGVNCRDYEYETTVARPDRTWWLLAPNPFAVLADSAPAGPVREVRLPDGRVVEEPLDVDVLGSMSRALHQMRVQRVATTTQYGTSYEVPSGATGGAVWPTGLLINLLLAAGAIWLTTGGCGRRPTGWRGASGSPERGAQTGSAAGSRPSPRGRRRSRLAGTTSGVPVCGSSMTSQGMPKTRSTSSAVTTSRGLPSTTTAPSFIAIRWVAYRQAWFRSCSTATSVWPCFSCRSAHRSVLSLPYLLERLVPQLKQAIDGDPATEVIRAS